MNIERFSKYSNLCRPFLFGLAFLLHLAAFYFFSFKDTSEKAEAVDFREAEVFKLVDIQELILPPSPKPVKKETVTVSNQPKASENIVETEKVVEEKQEDVLYLPQHKISSIPVIPRGEVLSRIVYPPMALKQGIEAVVFLELFIDSSGNIKKIKVLKDPGHGFAQAAVNAFTGITCIPANANGKNCAVRYRYPVKFTLMH